LAGVKVSNKRFNIFTITHRGIYALWKICTILASTITNFDIALMGGISIICRYFPLTRAACISRNSGIRKGLSATAVGQQTIIGSKKNGATNVSPVRQDYPCAVAPF